MHVRRKPLAVLRELDDVLRLASEWRFRSLRIMQHRKLRHISRLRLQNMHGQILKCEMKLIFTAKLYIGLSTFCTIAWKC